MNQQRKVIFLLQYWANLFLKKNQKLFNFFGALIIFSMTILPTYNLNNLGQI